MIDMWLNFKKSQSCTNAPNMTVAEVLEARKRQNIDINLLDDLMLATEVKTIQRNGIRFLNCDYFDERLYGFKSKVLIKYNLFDLTHIKVYTLKGEFLCTAERVTETHPMAKILGTVEDMEDFKQKIQKQKQLKRKTINSLKAYLPQKEIKLIEASSPEFLADKSAEILPSPHFAIASRRGVAKQPIVQTEFKECSTIVQGIFKNNSEKYEYLIKHNPDDAWVTEFKKTKEYKLLYD